MSIPPNSPYSSILDGYFGYLSQADKDSLWNTFKMQNGLTGNPANTDTQAITEFSNLIQLTYDMTERFQLSPTEMKNRELVVNIFDILIKFMRTVNDNISVLSKNIYFLSQYAQQYTNMIARVPIYIGNQSNQPVVNLQDLSKFTVGYDNISINDILTYTIKTGNSYTLGGGTAALLGSVYKWVPNTNTLTFTPNSDSYTIAFHYDQRTVLNTISPTLPPVIIPAEDFSVNIPYPSNATEVQKMDIAKQVFVGIYNTNTSLRTLYETVPNSELFTGSDVVGFPYLFAGTTPPEILWRYNYVFTGNNAGGGETYQAKSDAEANRRAQANQIEQQYIQNAAANRQILNDRKKQEQDILQADIENNKAANDIMQSLVRQMRDMVDAIFVKR